MTIVERMTDKYVECGVYYVCTHEDGHYCGEVALITGMTWFPHDPDGVEDACFQLLYLNGEHRLAPICEIGRYSLFSGINVNKRFGRRTVDKFKKVYNGTLQKVSSH